MLEDMEKYIAVTKETREYLRKLFKTTRQSVWRALYFENDTPFSKRIRKAAQERGGILMAACPMMETMHDADGYMRQYFPNGVMVECNKETGRVEIIKDGKAVEGYDKVSINQLYQIQARAERM
jgi:hypothetical protein